MLFGAKALLVFSLISSLQLLAQAQPSTPLPVHAVRTISPADIDFQDLEFLKAEIGPARVVMLGEPTHGEGNVFEAKIRLIKFLQQRLGFTTVAFESGFYDLHRAQRELEAGKPVAEVLPNGVYPVWTEAQEFQALVPLIGRGKLRVAGFDPQLGGDYGGELVEELQAFLAPEKGTAAVNYDYLEEAVEIMGQSSIFPPTTSLADFERELAKAARLIAKAAASPAAGRRTEADFWQQCLRSMGAQARDYATTDPGAKDEKEFKAQDSNGRDAQMADNLLWYLRAHPQEKVICWAALPHLANRAEALADPELQAFRPMGRAVKAALGPDQVYILGTLAGSGTHGFMFGKSEPVPAPAAGSLEAELLAQPADYAFVSLKHDAPGRVLTTYAFQYQALTGPWSEVVDGFLFLRSVNPPHPITVAASAQAVAVGDTAAARLAPSALNPAARPQRVRVAAGAAGQVLRGVVLDRKTGRPVPYASVSYPGQGVGTVADGLGRFGLPRAALGTVQVSSVGYATASVTPVRDGAALTVRLVPAAYELADVQVRGESLDPRKIMKKVLAALPKNYEQADYMAEVYTHRRLSNFDTLRYEAEYVSQSFEPAGHRDFNNGFLSLGPGEQHRVQEIRVLTKPTRPLGLFDLMVSGQGFLAAAADPVRISPLFKAGRWRKYTLHLDSVLEAGNERTYVLSFAVKRATHRTTGTGLTAAYTGRIHVQQRDYAVVRYEALWQSDTATYNATARKYAGRKNQIAALYNDIKTDSRTDHVVRYQRAANGRYHVASSVAQSVSAGHVLGKAPHHRQMLCEEYFTPLPAGTPLSPLNPKMDPRLGGHEIYQLEYADYRPEFWATYRRPTAADAPAAAAAKP